ncbi:MAG: DUF3881 family protein [Lachnospiraceae bacterium]|nr:DUF3881 family protein [Lachnospiraceae bacterium]MDD7378073.1 DUF3881 family protein [Lachnospiraceae bacterium]MDY4617055.1 DUF3881 family protein [Lachnospiraceae bacterium]
MHHFLNSVGFKNLKKQEDLDQLLQSIVSSPTSHMVAVDSEGNEYAEFVKEFGDSMGIMVRGRFMADDTFRIDYYVPYLRGEGVTSEEQIEIQKHSEKESYAGICDEVRLGVSLIFYLQNTAEYLNERNIFPITKGRENVTLAGLSVNGKIILPVNKNEKQKKNIKKSTQNRNHLIAAAREGDEEAIESLTLEDMDTYSMLSRRIAYEDILTIVDTCFMPYGIESDQYSVIGEILDYRITKNEQSKEEVYIMKIDTNGLVYDICINKEDLLGELEIGRRFKGSIWMQGRINYVN